MLLSRPRYETATKYGNYWYGELVIPVARAQEIEVIDLDGELANKAEFDRRILDEDPILIAGVGHGNLERWTGHQGQTLLLKGDPQDGKLMAGRHGSFLSCEFGASGPWWIQQGAKGIYGYKDLFYFVISQWPNQAAKSFFDSHMMYERTLELGGSHKEAWDATKKKWNEYIAKGDPYLVRYQIHDRDCMIFSGDLDSKPWPPTPKYQCEWCPFETDDKNVYLIHICKTHCVPEPCKSWIPKWIRELTGCQYD